MSETNYRDQLRLAATSAGKWLEYDRAIQAIRRAGRSVTVEDARAIWQTLNLSKGQSSNEATTK